MARDENDEMTDASHLAQFITTLGPPLPGFLARNPETRAEF